MNDALVCLGLISTLLLPTRSGSAQTESPSALSTDRPSIAAGSDVVSASWVIIENGFGFHRSKPSSSVDATESLIRYGLGRGVELRWSVPVFTRSSLSPRVVRSDGAIGMKTRLPSRANWPIAAIGGYSVPMASRGQGSGAWDPTLLMTCSHAWTPHLFSVATYNLYWTSSPSGPRQKSSQYAFEMGWTNSSGITGYLEAAPLRSSDATQAGYTADAGALWMRTPRVQWDVHAGLTRAGSTKQLIGGVGLSFLLPKHPTHESRGSRLPHSQI